MYIMSYMCVEHEFSWYERIEGKEDREKESERYRYIYIHTYNTNLLRAEHEFSWYERIKGEEANSLQCIIQHFAIYPLRNEYIYIYIYIYINKGNKGEIVAFSPILIIFLLS